MIVDSKEPYIVVKRTVHSGSIRFVVLQRGIPTYNSKSTNEAIYTDVTTFFEEAGALAYKEELMANMIVSEEVIG